MNQEYKPLSSSQLKARASFAREWVEDERIDKPEAFRLEMDAYLGRDTGPVKWIEKNEDQT